MEGDLRILFPWADMSRHQRPVAERQPFQKYSALLSYTIAFYRFVKTQKFGKDVEDCNELT